MLSNRVQLQVLSAANNYSNKRKKVGKMQYYITENKGLADYLKERGFILESIVGFYRRAYKFRYRKDMINYINAYECRKYPY